jgi:hypothetical protein
MNNREVSHLWAAQSRPRAKGSNFYFEGATIYSYGPHFPIATIHKRKVKGALFEKDNPACRFVLFSPERYSASTNRHQHYARCAVSHLNTAAVPHLSPTLRSQHRANIAYLVGVMEAHANKAAKRLHGRAVQLDAERAVEAHKTLADYLTFFRLRHKMPAMPSFAAAFERARRIENPDPASADKRERQRAVRVQRIRERDEYMQAHRENLARGRAEKDYWPMMATRTNWRLGEPFGRSDYSWVNPISQPTMLRINRDMIETSRGARVPVAAAPMVWAMVQRLRGRGWGAKSDGLVRRTIGDYPLDRIDADGTLHAGCHTIPYSELASMARQLGLT